MSDSPVRRRRLIRLICMVAIAAGLIWFGYEITGENSVDANGLGLYLAVILHVGLLIESWLQRSQQESAAWASLREIKVEDGWKPAGPILVSGAQEVDVVHHARVNNDPNITVSKIRVRRLLSRYLPSGSSEYRLDYNVLAVKLDVSTPHIFIDGRSQNRLGTKSQDLWSLTKRLSRRDKLPDLEGNFCHYFDVYVADKRYLSALTIVTPDVMIRLRDEGYNFDYEIFGSYVYVIADPRVTSPGQMQAMLKAAHSCLLELVPQITDHKYDDHSQTLRLDNTKLRLWAIVYSMRLLGKYMLKLVVIFMLCAALGSMIREFMQF